MALRHASNAATWTKPGRDPTTPRRPTGPVHKCLTGSVLPDCSDDDLLDELAVIVSTGWELPTRSNRERDVRHLLLLASPADSGSYPQAAQRLLTMLDDALREADDNVLGEDERTGCRILLGVHPNYRNEPSPTVRRREAADFLVPAWHERPPGDPAGTFQRRRQESALRQVLECLRYAYGQETEQLIRDHDVVRLHRKSLVSANRQITRHGETALYRIRMDGLEELSITEDERPPGVVDSWFRVVADVDEPAPVLNRIESIDTQPGRREIVLALPRPYQAGEQLRLTWEEHVEFEDDAIQWGRMWAAANAPNDSFEAEVTVTFAPDAPLPDVCWWHERQPDTDVMEIGPHSLGQIIDLAETRTATHSWSSWETERRIDYLIIWVWLDDDDSRARWEAARAILESDAP